MVFSNKYKGIFTSIFEMFVPVYTGIFKSEPV